MKLMLVSITKLKFFLRHDISDHKMVIQPISYGNLFNVTHITKIQARTQGPSVFKIMIKSLVFFYKKKYWQSIKCKKEAF